MYFMAKYIIWFDLIWNCKNDKQRPSLKNLSRGLNLSNDSNMVGSSRRSIETGFRRIKDAAQIH